LYICVHNSEIICYEYEYNTLVEKSQISAENDIVSMETTQIASSKLLLLGLTNHSVQIYSSETNTFLLKLSI